MRVWSDLCGAYAGVLLEKMGDLSYQRALAQKDGICVRAGISQRNKSEIIFSGGAGET
jgi:hypothetical protein